MITGGGTVHARVLHPLRAAREARNLTQEGLAAATGLSPETIRRAERGRPIGLHSRGRLCAFFQRSPQELGLAPPLATPSDLPPAAPRIADTGADDMNRRGLLGLLSVAGAALDWSGTAGVDWARLHRAATAPSGPDAAALDDLARLNTGLWHAYTTAPRTDDLRGLLGPAQEQLHQLTRLLTGARTAAQHQRLSGLLAEVGHLLGLVLYGTNQEDAAAGAYLLAGSAAREAQEYDLWAATLVVHAFIPLFDQRPDQALPLLESAAHVARRGDPTLATRHWVAAVSADPYAALGDRAAAEQAIGEAEAFARLPQGTGGNGKWLRFNEAWLLENRGASSLTMGHPAAAEADLKQALLYWPTPSRRRGLLLTDLARAALDQRDVERACAYGQEIVGLSQVCSGIFRKGLRSLSGQLDAFAPTAAVADLNERIRLVA
jgi:transcriptional regulator with XRE-family HTH domain